MWKENFDDLSEWWCLFEGIGWRSIYKELRIRISLGIEYIRLMLKYGEIDTWQNNNILKLLLMLILLKWWYIRVMSLC